ncbi:ATP-binding cassette domain-containing protein [Caminibacter sp.]
MVLIEGLKHHILDIEKLEINLNTAILGPNGSGKSLLMKVITHAIYPQKIKKREVFGKKLTLKEAREIFGVVESNLECFYKNQNITVFDAIISAFRESLVVYNFHKFSEKEKEKVLGLFEWIKLNKSKNISTCSLGELKKVLIARSVVHNPKILCLDEPTNGLDIKAKIEFLDFLETILQTKILITHDFKEISSSYSKIIMLSLGKIFKSGGRDILSYNNLSELFGMDEKRLKEYYG